MMDAALAGSIAELLKMGLGGIVIIGLGSAVVVLYRGKEKANEDRLADLRKCTEALVKATDSMERSSETLQGVQTALTGLVAELQARRGVR